MRTTLQIRGIPDESGFDMYFEEYSALTAAELAGFKAAQQWDKSLRYVPAIPWAAFARAAISTYIRELKKHQQ